MIYWLQEIIYGLEENNDMFVRGTDMLFAGEICYWLEEMFKTITWILVLVF